MTITNARLRRRDGLWTIRLDGERIGAVVPQPTEGPGSTVDGDSSPADGATINAGGGIVTEGFVNGHLHLCKVDTLSLVGDAALGEYHRPGMEGAAHAIELARDVKKHYRRDRLVPPIRRAVERADVVVHRAGTVNELLAEHAAPRAVIRNGRIVAEEGYLV